MLNSHESPEVKLQKKDLRLRDKGESQKATETKHFMSLNPPKISNTFLSLFSTKRMTS